MEPLITIVGLGSGDADQLSLGVWRKVQQTERRYVRTGKHPMLTLLDEEGLGYSTFDYIYEASESFPDVYEAITGELLRLAEEQATEGTQNGSGQQNGILYAVPGHPMVAERTVQLLRERCPERGIRLEIAGGQSFLDQAFISLGFDPIEGFQLLDAAGMQSSQLDPRLHTLIGQVYDMYTASEVKLTLMERYPDEHPVVVGHALGVPGEEQIVTIPLYELDRMDGYGNLSLIYVAASTDDSLRNRSFERLHEIVRILRSPEGCPWDREQTHQSIRKNFIEETYEAIEALDNDDPEGMREEFGDVVLQVMLHSQMEEELGSFSVYDVIQSLNEKLIFRHPHVFGGKDADNAEEALNNWEQMKAEEKAMKGSQRNSVLDGVPPMPALMKAYKLQKKAAKVGFDWDKLDDVFAKAQEELQELREAASTGDGEQMADELGDLLFAAVNLSRFLHADPEESLERTNRKFVKRFSYIEEQLRINGKTFDQTDLIEMDQWWEEAKRLK
ncbi:nucleoside triphosphate pyrophosphohydrolase [Paenibacillus pinihumi]|uniref:nucleoside triphosphate pyrophosphohydrolase n=1 Tax=Paenibacillus pinihumi TaxID=669462 RepID=UPI0004007ADB|nr:nucleoside triphosphate pyrophosphohydrolase [Paenibacillus pinihumi]